MGDYFKNILTNFEFFIGEMEHFYSSTVSPTIDCCSSRDNISQKYKPYSSFSSILKLNKH